MNRQGELLPVEGIQRLPPKRARSEAPTVIEAPRYAAPAYRVMLVREAPGTYEGRLVIDSPAVAADAVGDVLGGLAQERFVALLLNTKSRLLGIANVSEGSMTSVAVDPRVVFTACLLSGATRLLVAHNHPSGDCTPSREDLSLTRQLAQAGRIMGVPLLDHVIIGGDAFVSLHDHHPDLFTSR